MNSFQRASKQHMFIRLQESNWLTKMIWIKVNQRGHSLAPEMITHILLLVKTWYTSTVQTFLLWSRFSSLVEYRTIELKFSIFLACSCTLFSHSAWAFFSSSSSKAIRSLSSSVCQFTSFRIDTNASAKINHQIDIFKPVAVCFVDWGSPLPNALNENPEKVWREEMSKRAHKHVTFDYIK